MRRTLPTLYWGEIVVCLETHAVINYSNTRAGSDSNALELSLKRLSAKMKSPPNTLTPNSTNALPMAASLRMMRMAMVAVVMMAVDYRIVACSSFSSSFVSAHLLAFVIVFAKRLLLLLFLAKRRLLGAQLRRRRSITAAAVVRGVLWQLMKEPRRRRRRRRRKHNDRMHDGRVVGDLSSA